MENSTQGYSESEAKSYQLTQDIGTGDSHVEASVHRWLKNSLDSKLPKSGVIADIGCGSGRLLDWLRGPERALIGIDASREMLEHIELPNHQKLLICEDYKNINFSQELYIQADLGAGLNKLREQGLLVDAALSSFVMVCFPEPKTLINSAYNIIKPGGLFWLTTNLFVPEDLLGNSKENLKLTQPMKFKHWLHFPTGSVLLHDYAHDFNSVFKAFEDKNWEILDFQTFPAEGCEHIEAQNCFSPKEAWEYLKAGILVKKL